MEEIHKEPKIFTVSEITRTLKSIIEGSSALNRAWIRGEISNLTLHSSGHIYFSLKDENAVISAVFFRSYNARLAFKLEEGMSVLAFGSVTVFEKRGSYQLNVLQVRPEGLGELYKRIEQLKKKLQQEGLFDPSRKKPLPFLPRRIGVVTSPTGAAVRDIIKVALRRFPNIEIVVAPAQVQGDDAVESIVRAIRELNRPRWNIDVIIAGRGGGSFEDLMAFNEEPVVRAFCESSVPIISAVGHQVDHPLSDDAADLSAPTPSAAAELAVPDRRELVDEIGYLTIRINNAVMSYLRERQMGIDNITSRSFFLDPMDIINERKNITEDLIRDLHHSLKQRISMGKNRLLSVRDIGMLISGLITAKAHRFALSLNALDTMSPVEVLRRGYAVALDGFGHTLRSVGDVQINDTIGLHLHDGRLDCTVISIDKGGTFGKEKGT